MQAFLASNVDGKILGRLNEEALLSLNVTRERDRSWILENIRKYQSKSVRSPKEEPDKAAASRVSEWLSANKKYVVPLSPLEE